MPDLFFQAFKDTIQLYGGLDAAFPDYRDRKEEAASHPRLAFHPDDASVVFDDLPADRQAEACTLRFVCKGIPGLAETLKDFVFVFLGNADPRILDFHNDLFLVQISLQGHLSLFGELDCVGEQVDHHLDKLILVCVHKGEVWLYIFLQQKSFLLKKRRGTGNGPADDILHKYRLFVPFHAPRFNFGQVEHVVDEVGKAFPFRYHYIQVFTYLFHGAFYFLVVYGDCREDFILQSFPDDFGKAEYGGEGGAQLMAYGRQEGAFCFIGIFRPRFGIPGLFIEFGIVQGYAYIDGYGAKQVFIFFAEPAFQLGALHA